MEDRKRHQLRELSRRWRPVELGAQYSREGADELVYLDITASHEGRKTFTELVKQVAAHISIPFTVGGGINELKDVDRLLSAGADKVSINSAALRNPALIEEIAKNFGSQVCVVAIDANFENYDWLCYLNGGRDPTDKYLFNGPRKRKSWRRRDSFHQYDARWRKRRICERRSGYLGRYVAYPGYRFRWSGKDGTFPGYVFQRESGRGFSGQRFPFRRDTDRRLEAIPQGRGDQCKGYKHYI